MIMHSLTELPIQKLKRAVELREQIEALKAELSDLLPSALPSTNGHRNGHSNGHAIRRGRNGFGETSHGLSVAGRARIAAAQRLRWSKYRVTHTRHVASVSKEEPRLSAAGRARVSAAVRARWERFRAAKARALRAK
jgi:hypothetical protein